MKNLRYCTFGTPTTRILYDFTIDSLYPTLLLSLISNPILLTGTSQPPHRPPCLLSSRKATTPRHRDTISSLCLQIIWTAYHPERIIEPVYSELPWSFNRVHAVDDHRYSVNGSAALLRATFFARDDQGVSIFNSRLRRMTISVLRDSR